ncbi:Isoleucine--tRNA ligase [Frankliniella fusca]|uniref:Isoleucine--tRNA ligase n=1 Tax=Frankliniella fusca TaxID=407009 RepID=A0AAE1LEE0_9NEOP|nr:Isoleucine--tRNA ligase [Frankliniella fusca]
MESTCRHPNCNRCEEPRLTTEERQEIFETFWNWSDHNRQWLFIYGSVKTSSPRQKTAVQGGTQRRVCKTMFKNTLCICDSWIDSALSHFSKDGYRPDMRGKVRNGKRKDGATV